MNKIKFRKIILAILSIVLCLSLVACSNDKKESKDKVIKIGGTEISQISYEAMNKEFEKMGYKTEFVCFDSNPVVLEACNNGDVDIALGQHSKFVKSFDENNNGDLEMVKPYGYYTGIGLYSEKYDSVDQFPNGATIAIMNDAMNMDIGLRVLQKSGLIKLSDKDTGAYTIADIIENPKKVNIIDMEQAQTVRSLEDMDGALVFFTHMNNAGKDPKSYIIRDEESINCPMGPIVKKGNAKTKWAKDFASCLKVESVQKEIDGELPGVFTFYKDDSEVKE
ncbi:MetQ/NlpA family ABC transporter substrate-binding protein [Paraclostridium bifermentans]|uniref:MetQ/NlpA family ABC transporter substrate-binding protein n=1 Tax=Paraclostridium bifermentans TaxID=1490 RepID=UPI0022E38C3B|nr:MetQ/NlpA family ABC transporter substrate-binding protein [Paraclostridium bifermentans]